MPSARIRPLLPQAVPKTSVNLKTEPDFPRGAPQGSRSVLMVAKRDYPRHATPASTPSAQKGT